MADYRCPVCREKVRPGINGEIFKHRDGIGILCAKGSGQPFRVVTV